jgi:hypothetical protein
LPPLPARRAQGPEGDTVQQLGDGWSAPALRFSAGAIYTEQPGDAMAELTNLESKLAEVLGLAEASKGAAERVKGMLDEDEQDLASRLDRMHDEAVETAQRCTEVAGGFEGKKTAILEAARETKREAAEMMQTYLEGEDEALDGFEFLTMAEAGEVGHWAIVKKFNERAGVGSVEELTDWALPVQEEHLSVVLKSALDLAGREDPNEVAE